MVQRHLIARIAGAFWLGIASSVTIAHAESARAADRFPQPVRVGDLTHRYVLEPIEAQPVLGRVDGIVRASDGSLRMVIDRGGILGIGTTAVAVNLGDVALMGEHVALLGLKPDAFEALPKFDSAGFTAVPADSTIKMGIVGPFH